MVLGKEVRKARRQEGGSVTLDFYRSVKVALQESHATRNALLQIIGVNICTIIVVVYAHWSFMGVLVVFWLQNIVMRLATTARYLVWPNIVFVNAGDEAIASVRVFKWARVGLFVVVFFGINVLLMTQIATFHEVLAVAVSPAASLAVALFAVDHAFSFVSNYQRDTARPVSYSEVNTEAFIRTGPLFLLPFYALPVLIVAGLVVFVAYLAGVTSGVPSFLGDIAPVVVLVLFMLLKGAAEIFAYMVSHTNQPVKVNGVK